MKKYSLIFLLIALCSLCGCSGKLAVEAMDASGSKDVPIGIGFLVFTPDDFNNNAASINEFELLYTKEDGVLDVSSIRTEFDREVYLCANYYMPYSGRTYEYAQRLIITGGMYGTDVTYSTSITDIDKETMQINGDTVNAATFTAVACTTETDRYLKFYHVYEREDGSLYCKDPLGPEYLGSGSSISTHQIITSDIAWTDDRQGINQIDITISVERKPWDLTYTLTYLDRDNRPVGETVTMAAVGSTIPGFNPPENAAFLLIKASGTGCESNTLYNLEKDPVPIFISEGRNDGMLRVLYLNIE